MARRRRRRAAPLPPPGARAAGAGADATVPEDDVEMGFFDHLRELRKRLIRALYGVIPGVAAGWIFREELLAALVQPFHIAWLETGREEGRYFLNHADGCGVDGKRIRPGDPFYFDTDTGEILCSEHGEDPRDGEP